MSLEPDEKEDEETLFHFETRCPYTLSVLAICSPLHMMSTLCTVMSVMYNVAENHMIHTDSQDQEHTYCDKTYYIHLMNGYCTRGQTFSVDVEKSCKQWSNTAFWETKDAENLFRYNLYATHAQYFATQNKTYAITDLAGEAAELWPFLSKMALIAIAISVLNMVLCISALDTDYIHNKIGIKDVDLFLLSFSFVFTSATLVFDAYFVYETFLNSEMTENPSWTTKECDYTVSPTIGTYVLILGGLFGLFAWISIVYSFVFLYLVVDCCGYCLPQEEQDLVQAIKDAKKHEKEQHEELERKKKLEKEVQKVVQFANTDSAGHGAKVAPAPEEGTSLLVAQHAAPAPASASDAAQDVPVPAAELAMTSKSELDDEVPITTEVEDDDGSLGSLLDPEDEEDEDEELRGAEEV